MRKLILLILATVICLAMMMSCRGERVITTRAECNRSGDTSVVIQTKTTETYDGTIKYKR